MKQFHLRDLFWLILVVAVGLVAFEEGSRWHSRYMERLADELGPPPLPPPADRFFTQSDVFGLLADLDKVRPEAKYLTDDIRRMFDPQYVPSQPAPDLIETLKRLYGPGEPLPPDHPLRGVIEIQENN